MFSFKLPDIGEGVTEGEIVKWHVHEGDHLSRDQDMVEVMTDKVTVKIPSPVEGTVAKIVFPEGQIAAVGSQLILIDTGDGEDLAEAKPSQQPIQVSVVTPEPSVQEQARRPEGSILASPAVRRIARERGVDLHEVQGTADNGRVTMEDLQKFIERPKETAKPEPVAREHAAPEPVMREQAVSGSDEILEPRGLRRLIFEKMTKSKQIIPHFTVVEDVDVTAISSIIAKLSEMDTKITYTSFFVKAATVVLREHPYLNAVYNETAHNYTLRKAYNIGIAVDTPDGLTVVVIMDADRKSLVQIGAEVSDLAGRARTSNLKLSEVQNSTFTVSNVGTIGGLMSTPIINYPEVAILGVHRIRTVIDGGEERKKMYLSLSCDHRLIDGAMATRFLVRLKDIIEKPEYFLVR